MIAAYGDSPQVLDSLDKLQLKMLKSDRQNPASWSTAIFEWIMEQEGFDGPEIAAAALLLLLRAKV